jgi:hypothetical protein
MKYLSHVNDYLSVDKALYHKIILIPAILKPATNHRVYLLIEGGTCRKHKGKCLNIYLLDLTLNSSILYPPFFSLHLISCMTIL